MIAVLCQNGDKITGEMYDQITIDRSISTILLRLGPSGKLESVLSRKMETHKRGVRGGER